MTRWVKFSVIIFLLACIIIPYIFAEISQGSQFVFAGFLFNPLDGNSYYAKMIQGESGSWATQFLYSPNSENSANIFLYYLFLGHVAQWFNLSLIFVFHISRIINSIILLVVLNRFLKLVFNNEKSADDAFILLIFGSGLGWLVSLTGYISSDFLIAEAYPFLSMFSNPHFPLALALLLDFLYRVIAPNRQPKIYLSVFLEGIILSLISPFMVVIGGLTAGLSVIIKCVQKEKQDIWKIILFVSGGLPMMIYQQWVVKTDPVFAIWNAQNVTKTPPLWDILLSFSPALIFAIMGLVNVVKRKNLNGWQVIVSWLVAGIVLAYVPFNLQRRFLSGYYIPCGILAIYGLCSLFTIRKRKKYFLIIFLFSIITNIFLLGSVFQAISSHDRVIYLTQDENSALEWIKANTEPDAVILASPEMGNFIPAFTGRSVIYGHPYESINAERAKADVIKFISGNDQGYEGSEFLYNYSVDYIFWGEREKMISENNLLFSYPLLYLNDSVSVFAIK